MFTISEGVDVARLRGPAIIALMLCNDVANLNGGVFVLARGSGDSACDEGQHADGFSFDFTLGQLTTDEKDETVKGMTAFLGDSYVVARMEDEKGAWTWHVEWVSARQ